ncbi:MAG: hypothetical protein KAX57_14920 [Rhodoferax sp.]|uniref:hypothetical protein n=1 Tax=Rhodoferax sp. TaxID=50421 RepID=UPI001B6E16CB|nr:hypothetical protein [Rhodoferax sp.]MBP8288116.1 hypothetical protein [Rhodoferax sp.]MBP9905892.1 hypothetical protein [Rhodoferax sp.]
MTETSANESAAPAAQGSRLKNIGLFLISPFIGLYYAVLLPGKLFQLAMNERKSVSQAGQASK